MMFPKDYYKILEVGATATQKEIKTSYRKLAQRYHPDKNQGNPISEAYFREVMEAYQVLSNPRKRETYNYERWHHRSTGNKFRGPAFSPQTILYEILSTRKYLSTIDRFQMNQEALYFHLKEILSDHNLLVLHECKNEQINHQILHELIAAAQPLHFKFAKSLGERLIKLAGTDTGMIDQVKKYLDESKRNNQWERYKIPLTLLATLLISLLILYLSRV
ncbi:MAG: J domain-containing protein [Bacteroidetes bacterium]|jgi:molecular chaperone DnaJ|nr:J domain-containing protein [Bacteroidota bacterium]